METSNYIIVLYILWYLCGLIANWRLFWGLVRELDEFYDIDFFDKTTKWKWHIYIHLLLCCVSSMAGALLFIIYPLMYKNIYMSWWYKTKKIS